MLRGVQTFLNDGKDAGQVMIPQRDRIEPETREYCAAIKAVYRESHRLVAPLAEHEPVDLAVEHAPDNVFADAIAAVNLELDAEIVAGTTGSNLGHHVRRAFHVIVGADSCLAAALRLDEEKRVRLGLVVEIEADAAVVSALDTGSSRLVVTQPITDVQVRSTVSPLSYRRWHVDDPFDQLGFLQLRHRLVPALKLGAGQPIAVFEFRDELHRMSGRCRF